MANYKCLCFQEWMKNGILFVKDLINENGMFKTDAELFELIPNRQHIFSQILMIEKYVRNKFKSYNLSIAKYTKDTIIKYMMFQIQRANSSINAHFKRKSTKLLHWNAASIQQMQETCGFP